MKPNPNLTNQFQTAFSRLNPQQKQAVTTIEGPVMVLAGPGTGKTQTIALRIAYILQHTDTDPSAILALTFTDAAAQAMHRRLATFIGETAYQVTITTFHTFALNLIHNHPDIFASTNFDEALTDLEKIKFIQTIIDQLKLKYLRPLNRPYFYLSAIISSISTLKREGFSPSTFSQHLDSFQQQLLAQQESLSATKFKQLTAQLHKNQELLQIYKAYQTTLKQHSKFDFDDMIQVVVDQLTQHQDLLLDYQERYHYFLVDEYQDTNTPQNQLIFLLTNYWQDQANLFVVGDPNQSIFRFQGASLANTLNFLQRFPKATVIGLETNYRSQQTILDSAHQLITHQQTQLDENLPQLNLHLQTATNYPPQPIQVIQTTNSQTEIWFLITQIQSLLKQGVKPQEIAVITRTNQDLDILKTFFRQADLPFNSQSPRHLLANPFLRQLIYLFRIVATIPQLPDDLDFFTLLNYDFLNLPSNVLIKLNYLARQHNQTLFEFLLNLPSQLDSLSSNQTQPFVDFVEHLLQWQQFAHNHTFIELFELIINQSGFLNYLLDQPDSLDHLTALNALFTFAKQLNLTNPNLSINDFLESLDILHQYHLTMKIAPFNFSSQAIQLTTAHSAKGLEWDYVFIYRVTEGHWSNLKTRQLIKLPPHLLSGTTIISEASEKLAEERRLFYVALTRARRQVFITYANLYTLNQQSQSALPSVFISELGDSHLDYRQFEPSSSQIKFYLQTTFKPAPPIFIDDHYLLQILDQFRLSPTALNTYLSCPYKFKLNNLLRVPRAKQPHLAFGTAVHKALERFFSRFQQTRQLPSKDYLLSAFSHALKDREILNPQELHFRLREGQEILSAYYDFYHSDFTPGLFLEHTFSHLYLHDIPLTGKIDKIEWLDQSKNLVRLVDYKTGKPKSSNFIEGKTKNSTGDLKRQLVFYQLLVNLDTRFKFKVGEVELDFIAAPRDNHKSGKRRFRITDQEVNDLKILIQDTMTAIRQLKFPRTKDLSQCAKCDLRHHCWPQGLPK